MSQQGETLVTFVLILDRDQCKCIQNLEEEGGIESDWRRRMARSRTELDAHTSARALSIILCECTPCLPMCSRRRVLLQFREVYTSKFNNTFLAVITPLQASHDINYLQC